MEAFFDQYRHPKIQITIFGSKQKAKLEALLDTGFDGFLCLPIAIAVNLGLELIAVKSVEYADGRISDELSFSVNVAVDGKFKIVTATLTSAQEALVGTALFSDYTIQFDFHNQKIQIIK